MEFKVKQCSKCKESFISSAHNYYSRKSSIDGLRGQCKKCETPGIRYRQTTPKAKKRKALNNLKHYNDPIYKEKRLKQQKLYFNSNKFMINERARLHCEHLDDCYIYALLIDGFKRTECIKITRKDIPQELIALKRKELSFKRKISKTKVE